MCRFSLVVAILLAAPPAAGADATVSFQQGVASYLGTEDLHIAIPADFNGNGHLAAQYSTDPDYSLWAWDFADVTGTEVLRRASQVTRFGWGDEMGLLRFRAIFGDLSTQVPPGSEIVSASLEIHPFIDDFLAEIEFAPGDRANLHEILEDWNETVRWESFGPSPGPQMGVDYGNSIVANTGSPSTALVLDVTSSVQRWSDDPSRNKGWIFVPVGNQDITTLSGSALANVTNVTVDLRIDAVARSELVVTLRHGDYTALLLNRLDNPCLLDQEKAGGADLDVTLDDGAPEELHYADESATPLTGTYRPDSACLDMPLCTGGGTAGLCGQPANGDWVLTVTDEWSDTGANAVVQSWTLHLSDGVNPDEHYSSSPAMVIDERGGRPSFNTNIWSSEAPDQTLRPRLEITYRNAPTFDPSTLNSVSGTGVVDVLLSIPAGSTASSAVTVTVSSDDTAVAQVLNSPVVFPQGGATSQNLQILVGAAGSATLTASNDAALPDSVLRVNASALGIQVSPSPLYRSAANPDEVVEVTIPYGSNATSAVDLTVSTSDEIVFDLVGGTGGSLSLNFAAGSSNSQTITLSYVGEGVATLTATDDSATLASGNAMVRLSEGPALSYELHVEPYIQLGDPAPASASDQLLVVWQTILREMNGIDVDTFSLEYRLVGAPAWTPAPAPVLNEVGSTSRINHVTTLAGLNYDAEYEYKLVHLRNGVPLTGGTYQDRVRTRSTGAFTFSAIGNTGSGTSAEELNAALLASLDSDLHFFLGDFNYNIGQYEHMRPRVFDIYGEAMSSRLSFFVIGNHESVTDRGEPSRAHSYTTTNGPPEHGDGLTYSFDVGDVHFSVVSIHDAATLTGPWLAADLASSTKPWKIVVAHEPGFTADPYGTDRQYSVHNRDHVLKAAVDAGANLYLAGATHSFQRYLPITAVDPAAEEPDPGVEWAACSWGQGTTLIHAGAGGWFRGVPGPLPNILDPPMQSYLLSTGIQTLAISGDTLTAEVVNLNGEVIDSMSFNNCQNPADCICPVCGDGATEDPEECDDGNTADGDGCASDCQQEFEQPLFGEALGGTISITLEGVTISLTTNAFETNIEVLARLATSINASLPLGGVYAFVQGERIVTNGFIDEFDISGDAGLSLHASELPSLTPLGSTLLLLMLAGLGLIVRWAPRRSGTPS